MCATVGWRNLGTYKICNYGVAQHAIEDLRLPGGKSSNQNPAIHCLFGEPRSSRRYSSSRKVKSSSGQLFVHMSLKSSPLPLTRCHWRSHFVREILEHLQGFCNLAFLTNGTIHLARPEHQVATDR